MPKQPSRDSILRYETALKTGKSALIAHGTEEESAHAKDIFSRTTPEMPRAPSVDPKHEGECIMKLLPERPARKVRFDLSVEPGSQVFVAGTFNDWNPMVDQLKDNPGSGHCKATLRLPAGRHEYKFVVNGKWIADPNCSEFVMNEFGTLNSVMEV
jgi:hypothetical protein